MNKTPALKIAIASFTFLPDRNGVANMALLQAKTLQELGHEVEVITEAKIDRPENDLIDSIKIKRYSITGNGSLLHPIHGDGVKKLTKELSESTYNVIFVHGWQTWCLDIITRSKAKAPIIMISHGISVNTYYDAKSFITYLSWIPYKLFSLKKIYNRISGIAFLSDQIDNDRFYDAKHAPSKLKKFIIPNPYQHQNTTILANKINNAKPRILSVGAYSSLKNEKALIHALGQSKLACRVDFVGYHNNKYLQSLKLLTIKKASHFKKYNIEITFHVEMNESEINQLYLESDLFISTSRTECLPLVIIQAMAHGIPFISSDVGCVRSLPGGEIYKSNHELISMLNQLNNSIFFEQLKQNGQSGKSFVAEKLNMESYKNNQVDILNWIIEEQVH